MKSFILLSVAILFMGCGNHFDKSGRPCMAREIPHAKQEAATAYVQAVMKSIVVQSRNDNEDWDDFISSATESAMKIYGAELKGTLQENDVSYTHCNCEEERAKAQQTTNARPVHGGDSAIHANGFTN